MGSPGSVQLTAVGYQEIEMTGEDRVKYYMGRWYDRKIVLNRIDYLRGFEFGRVFLTDKMELSKLTSSKNYASDLYPYLSDDREYLVAFGDLRLGPGKIQRQTHTLGDDLPILVKAAHSGEDRMGIITRLNVCRHWNIRDRQQVWESDISWGDKLDKVVWRGVPTGSKKFWRVEHADEVPKGALRVELVRKYGRSHDVGFSQLWPEVHESWRPLLKGPAGISRQLKYKYLLSIEGNDVASGLKWQLLSNSVVIMPPPTAISWAMEDKLRPYEHYVPLDPALGNLEEVLQWCRDNDETCREIAERGTAHIKLFLNEQREKRIMKAIIGRYDRNVVSV